MLHSPSTTAKEPPEMTATTTAATCGFCATGNHDQCPGKIRNARKPQPAIKATATAPAVPAIDSTWTCPCGCATTPKCLDCKHAADGEVDPATWVCFDQHACAARRQAKMDANEALQRMKGYEMVRATATKGGKATAPAKTPGTRPAPAAPKVGKCLHTGKPTKGGKFAPGQDAAYVSAKVKSVMAKQTTEAAVKKEMQGHGLSEALIAKFVKGLAIAAEKERSRAAAEADAKAAKAAAKK